MTVPAGYPTYTTCRRKRYVAWLYACHRGRYRHTLAQRMLMSFADTMMPIGRLLPPEMAHRCLIKTLQLFPLFERRVPRGLRHPSDVHARAARASQLITRAP